MKGGYCGIRSKIRKKELEDVLLKNTYL